MEEKINKIVDEIQENYKNNYGFKDEKDIFYHILERVGMHISKIAKLKDNTEEKERFEREIADLYLLSLGLMKNQKVSDENLLAAADYYLNKTKKLK